MLHDIGRRASALPPRPFQRRDAPEGWHAGYLFHLLFAAEAPVHVFGKKGQKSANDRRTHETGDEEHCGFRKGRNSWRTGLRYNVGVRLLEGLLTVRFLGALEECLQQRSPRRRLAIEGVQPHFCLVLLSGLALQSLETGTE